MGHFHRLKLADFGVLLRRFLVYFPDHAGNRFVEEEVEKKMKFV
jgi:hypothetical protein